MCTPLPLPSFYLHTDRIFRELRQRVFTTEIEIRSEPKPVEAEARLAVVQVEGAVHRMGALGAGPCSAVKSPAAIFPVNPTAASSG